MLSFVCLFCRDVYRMTNVACQRYLVLEERLSSSNSESYEHDQHDAYGTAVIIALRGVLNMSKEQFQRCLSWFVEILAKLVLCDDIDVRCFVSDIYLKQINILLT